MKMRTRQSGFTLVEIAIVLVIIGLLLGGILKGQEMITQARIKNVVNDLNGITAAYFSYQDRYKAIPGDDLAAPTRWASFGVTAGDGNGALDGTYNGTPTATAPSTSGGTPSNGGEALIFWWQLRAAGFVPGPTSGQGAWSQPNNAVGGIVGVQNAAFTGLGAMTGNVICTSNIPDKIAGAVDSQLDDQKSNAGSVRSDLVGGNPAATGTPETSYTETGDQQYLMCKSI
ncbi:MAG: prepilin-type N-terminal cleavage/methylation domain-containing protein [Burkholderiales bacterium]